MSNLRPEIRSSSFFRGRVLEIMTRRNDVPEIFIEVELSIARSGSDQYFKAVKKF